MQPATTSSQALQNLQQFSSAAQSPQQLISGANQSLGVDAAQQQVSGLQKAIGQTTNLLNQVAPSVMGRTANSLVTSGQANNQIAQQSAPIQTNLQNDTSAYNQANTDYANKEQQAQQLVNAEQTGQSNQQSYLQGIYNDLYTAEQNQAQQAEAQREFNTSQANALKSASGSGVIPIGPGSGVSSSANQPSNRDAYNGALTSLAGTLSSANHPTYEQAVSSLVNEFGGKGISPQEIGSYLYQLYGQHFNMAGTKPFYG